MKNIKHVLAIIIVLISSAMIFFTWPTDYSTPWMVALVGWLEVINYQRNEK
jgi:hypothetical protein